MARVRSAVMALVLVLLVAASAVAQESGDAGAFRLAFGSCMRQDRPAPVWEAVVALKPDAFLFLGDNIYGDTTDMAVMRAKYAQLAAVPAFARLRAATPVLATWDDHDYGANDAGREFPMRAESRAEFAAFFGLDPATLGDGTLGVYHAKTLGPADLPIQVILLDTRTFRSPLKKDGKRIVPNDDEDATILGEAQWVWLAEQLQRPAKLRVIASSIQFVADGHRYEKWANFPRERRRLLDLIAETKAHGVVIVSGDRHSAEIMRLDDTPFGYPLIDATGSALNQARGVDDPPSPMRVGEVFPRANFGVLTVDPAAADPTVTLDIRDEAGAVVNTVSVRLSELVVE